ncbi:hypothetical protein AMTRI_Chr06g193570 [Amborella trichopoda]
MSRRFSWLRSDEGFTRSYDHTYGVQEEATGRLGEGWRSFSLFLTFDHFNLFIFLVVASPSFVEIFGCTSGSIRVRSYTTRVCEVFVISLLIIKCKKIKFYILLFPNLN